MDEVDPGRRRPPVGTRCSSTATGRPTAGEWVVSSCSGGNHAENERAQGRDDADSCALVQHAAANAAATPTGHRRARSPRPRQYVPGHRNSIRSGYTESPHRSRPGTSIPPSNPVVSLRGFRALRGWRSGFSNLRVSACRESGYVGCPANGTARHHRCRQWVRARLW